MIELRGLAVTFNPGTPMAMPALRGIEVSIPAGQFVTVIGSNGAGKSTVLNAITGDVTIEAGSIIIDDQDVTKWPPTRRTQLVARVFQDPLAGSCAELTIEENMALAAARGRPRGLRLAIDARRRDAFRSYLRGLGLGLEHRLGDRMGLLSGGQRQAVSLMMATLMTPSRSASVFAAR
jgi:putative ABC transport system ATP-binding protein